MDCAFSFAFDPQHDALLEAVREATETGIAHAGPDARVRDVGAAVREVMESHEVRRARRAGRAGRAGMARRGRRT